MPQPLRPRSPWRVSPGHVLIGILTLLAVWSGNSYAHQLMASFRSLIAKSAPEEPDPALYSFSTKIPESYLLAGYLNHLNDTDLSLEVTNPTTFQVDLTGVQLSRSRSIKVTPPVSFPPFAEELAYKSIPLVLPDDLAIEGVNPEEIWLEYRRNGSDLTGRSHVNPYPVFSPDLMGADPFRTEWKLPTLPFVELDRDSGKLIFRSGDWILTEDIRVPGGYELVFQPGFRLRFSQNAKLLTRSPILAEGTAENPIVFDSDGGVGQGIAVLQPQGESRLKHVVFKNLSAPKQGGWELTGAVTFYEAPVSIAHSRFSNCQAEDSLNLVRSRFSIEDTIFEDALSDAVDADFSDGIVSSSEFFRCGNDCLDFSGSEVILRGVKFQEAGDKAISVGERSRITGQDLTILRSVLGIASKDSSTFSASNVRIESTVTPLAAYQKKPEFSGGSISLTQSAVSGCVEAAYRDRLSSISVNNAPFPACGSALTLPARSK